MSHASGLFQARLFISLFYMLVPGQIFYLDLCYTCHFLSTRDLSVYVANILGITFYFSQIILDRRQNSAQNLYERVLDVILVRQAIKAVQRNPFSGCGATGVGGGAGEKKWGSATYFGSSDSTAYKPKVS